MTKLPTSPLHIGNRESDDTPSQKLETKCVYVIKSFEDTNVLTKNEKTLIKYIIHSNEFTK